MADHPPAARRAILRRLKAGEHPVQLAKEASTIGDAAHRAAVYVHLAEDERLPAAKAASLVRDATDLLRSLDRPGRTAEAWGDALSVAVKLERGPETDNAIARMQRQATSAIQKLPDGQWVTDAIVTMAPFMDADGRRMLMRRGLRNRGGELQAAKALVALDDELRDLVKSDAPPEVQARLLSSDDDATTAAWAIEDLAKRREALRVLSTKLEVPHELMALGGSSREQPPEEQVACWTMVGARLDRLGHDATAAFGHATKALANAQGREATKAHRKLAQAMERSGLTPPPPPSAGPAPDAATDQIPIKPLERHAFCIVDGYTGGLGAPHLRAIARAAPLCIAFDLDLVLMGFPTDSAKELVGLVEGESNVGEDGGYARMLLESDRLHLAELVHGLPKVWPGTPVATTPHPDGAKNAALDEVAAPIALLVGQGKQGLPKRMLDVVPHHHELTGRGISMETATAMGILADRLGRVPRA